jgi:ELWxxDGT repeat protein
VLVTPITPNLGGFAAIGGEPTVVGNSLFFVVGGLQGFGLWRSDGTADGTLLVRNFPADRNSSAPHSLTAVGDWLFFSASQAETGPELWVSDGTANGTQLVKDINPGPSGSAVSQLTAVDDVLFFVADDGTHGCELWVSDGTEAATSLLRDINPSTDCGGMFDFTGPSALANADGALLFSATDGVLGRELYRSDGTPTGTVLVKDINDASLRTADAFPSPIGAVNGVLLFTADDGSQTRKLWKSDGSARGTSLIGAIDAQPGVVANGTLFFGASGGLWRSDGTKDGTAMVKAIPSYFFLPFPGASAVAGDTLFFVAGNSELWRSDGTALGTTMVQTLSSSGFGIWPYISSLTKVGDTLFFIVAQQTSNELWRSDGSEAGTIPLRTFAGNVSDLTALNGKLFFSAGNPETGVKLWGSDGTPDGTGSVEDTAFGSTRLSSPLGLIAVNGSLHFVACDAVNGCALWRSDGTTAGTVIVKVLLPDASQVRYLSSLVLVNDVLVFAICADEGACALWRSDDSEPGTFTIANAVPGDVAVAGRTLFFTEEVPGTGALLWKSDGTTAGTTRIKVVDSRPPETIEERQLNLTPVGEQILFTGYDAATGEEPWVSDGTEAGTRAIRDILPGAASSSPSYPFPYAVAGSTVFFAANDGQHGRELWAVSSSSVCVGDCDGSNEVTVDELVMGGAIALGIVAPNACVPLDWNHDDKATIDELLTAVGNAVNGCR